MRRKRTSSGIMLATAFLIILLGTVHVCDGHTRNAQRRKDSPSRTPYVPAPSVETLKELAEAMGAAGFEHYTEGKALVKRLIPENSEPDLDEISHNGVIGKAGVDFPAFPNIPPTGFNCKNVPTGYYADLETDCQVFHICDTSRKISFLCPNGTIFSQSHLICDWWFKVDCASSPALYESSAEYYSNEQKKTHKVTQSLSKNSDLQQISDASNIKEKTQPIRRVPFNTPTTTERLSRHRQRLQSADITPLSNVKATARSYQALYAETNFNTPTQRPPVTNNGFEKRRKNLVQLVANNFGNTPTARSTLPSYTDSSTYRSSSGGDYNSLREMQVAAESASFTNNNNRQYLQDYNNKNFRPYPVYNPDVNSRSGKTKSSHSTLTTLFVHDIRDKHFNNQVTRANYEFTTKRPTLLPYTRSYGNLLNDKHEPYTRPGVHLLKDYLDKEKNKTASAKTEKHIQVTERIDQFDNKPAFESVTKIPVPRSQNSYFTQPASSDRFDVYSSTNNFNQISTEPTYHERRERLMKKLNLENLQPTEPTLSTTNTEKQFGRRPGLIVPPSLTPKTLHTLAIYYATALDNLSTTTPPNEDDESSTTYLDQFGEIEEGLPALFSSHTINKYSSLFGQGVDHSDLLEELKFDPNSTNEINDDLSVQQSQNPLSTSPQIRELAQVFTHALSAYLQDPVQFRKVLSDIRPTHPSFGDMLTTTTDDNLINTEPTTTINEEDEEILGFSDENKIRPALAQLRDPKALNLVTVQPRIAETTTVTTPRPFASEVSSTTSYSTTTRHPFRCCGRISASYTSASTEKESSTTPITFTLASRINTLAPNSIDSLATTENTYTVPKYGGFQNNSRNSSPYGKEVKPSNSKPLNDYVEATNLPTAWGGENSNVSPTVIPITNSQNNVFESRRIPYSSTFAPITTTPEYITDSESIELENEEELQRAHSQSFVTPQNNNVQRQGKNVNFESEKRPTIKKPSEDLEAPTIPEDYDSTTLQPTTTAIPTTNKNYADSQTTTSSPSGLFTSPDSETTNNFQWAGNFENWHSTVILDPITLNDGLSATGPQSQQGISLAGQTTAWSPTPSSYFNTATTVSDYSSPVYTGGISKSTNEQAFSSSQNIEQTTPSNRITDNDNQRSGRLLKYPPTEVPFDLTTIEETVVEKAKEIMGGMNSTTTEKLMNVMKKTKSKTVRRLILLLVQTCDDDHNSTAEASKKALLEALMAVSQKDMDEIAKEDSVENVTADYDINKYTNAHRRMDRVTESRSRLRNSQRSAKSINIDASAINSLTNPSTTESVKTTTGRIETTTVNTTPSPFSRTTPHNKRGVRKFLVRTSPVENRVTVVAATTEGPKFEARVAHNTAEQKIPSDTRAIELLKSLYTIAARWG